MKKIASYVWKGLFLTLIPAFLALSGCTNDIDSASTVLGIDSSADDASALNDNDGKSDKDTRKDYGSNDGSGSSVIDFGDNFIRGFDASAVDYYENNVDGKGAVTYKDTDGTTADFFVILAKHGYDTVRLRIWNDPSQQVEGSVPVGDNTLERTISMAKRIKAAGLKLMLDFHYSDTWTDPAKQYVPRAWLDAESKDDIASRVSEYTTSVLQSLKDEAEIVPSYVQIGNEINSGMIRDKTTPSSTNPDFDYAGTGDTQAQYLESASEAVRAFDESIKIIVHVTSSNTPTNLLNRLKSANLDYDIIGLSYYPWENHGTISAMISNVKNWKSTYGKDVIIAETSAQFAGDDSTVSKRNYSYQYMIDPDTSELYSDLTTETVSSTICVVGSVANAKAILRHIMQETFDAEGIGCVAWGGEMHGDWDGKAMDNIDAFNYKPADGYPTENSSDGNSSDNTGGGY
ncbi:MAG: glycosyl hydrolase 53 family protein [Treponema sp.]|uniref:glycosyl hydrolase 53 family protein n=1 Tax=Treponema sp. TaxID=166 RepID=UPI0025DA8BB0|nr:glycosyl hydrolase 53 family protein [Treponema sp.]MBQ9623249.1 glycosyl hydrolase 53 family protein [Treponema sp.]MBR0494660.1 glycosyl hydrolase 53 family protein [Treponema sp.]